MHSWCVVCMYMNAHRNKVGAVYLSAEMQDSSDLVILRKVYNAADVCASGRGVCMRTRMHPRAYIY
jgi:hypothetical protein